MPMSERLRGLIAQKTPSLSLFETPRGEGMRTIREATVEKVLQGVTTVSEMVRVSGVM
jgi:type II secretory ATPase GspE/PulE/Tfp pilus assembly ATPase PilB-like protein